MKKSWIVVVGLLLAPSSVFAGELRDDEDIQGPAMRMHLANRLLGYAVYENQMMAILGNQREYGVVEENKKIFLEIFEWVAQKKNQWNVFEEKIYEGQDLNLVRDNFEKLHPQNRNRGKKNYSEEAERIKKWIRFIKENEKRRDLLSGVGIPHLEDYLSHITSVRNLQRTSNGAANQPTGSAPVQPPQFNLAKKKKDAVFASELKDVETFVRYLERKLSAATLRAADPEWDVKESIPDVSVQNNHSSSQNPNSQQVQRQKKGGSQGGNPPPNNN